MKRLVVYMAFFVMLSSVVNAAQSNYEFSDETMRQSFLQLTETLRCPKCQNQNIADSNAMIALDMRRKVYQLLQEGRSEEEVIAYMKSRYGDFVYYHPPLTPVTALLWLIPVLFVVLGGSCFFVLRRNDQQPLQTDTTVTKRALDKANALLDED